MVETVKNSETMENSGEKEKTVKTVSNRDDCGGDGGVGAAANSHS